MDITSLWKSLPRAARVYLTAVGALSVAGVAGVATVAATSTPLLAASPSPSPSANPGARQAYCNTFTGHVAANLGKTPAQVQKAITDAIGQTLNDAVKNGDLTQQQAAAIKSRLGSGNAQACAAVPGPIGRRGGIGAGFPRAALGLNEVAKALGISQSELQSDLRSGKTVKDLAAAKGMDEAAFRSKLASVTKADLDPQVASGKITQKQEDAALQRIQNGPLPLWDRPAPRLPGGRKANPSPSPTPTP
ncbi:MAG TPA: hypothetical protein VOB72_23865 [Candidatus Dormibacteraeota bacterium]|nr:hypothetical protein [Candidatus Dormibacteraeota bacterium]